MTGAVVATETTNGLGAGGAEVVTISWLDPSTEERKNILNTGLT